MTNEAASATTTLLEEDLLGDLTAEFSGYRNRIASMVIEAGDATMRMFSSFALIEEVQMIDIEAIEWDTFDLASMLDATDDSVLLEFAAA